MNPDVVAAGSPWTAAEIDRFLTTWRSPLRLAVNTDAGFPLICSLWFLYHEGRIQCATPRSATVVECLQGDPKCGFELAPNEPPYFGVRGRGVARISSDGSMDLLGRLVDRHLGRRDTKFARWLLGRSVDEVTITIDIDWITSWDFSRRMSG
jgi:hypothetical protein